MNYILLITFIASLGLGIFFNNFFIKRPIKFLIKKANKSAIRFSTQSKPILGGLGFYAVFLIVIIASLLVLEEEIYLSKEYLSLLIIVTMSFVMGLADDIINTPPSFKFIVQFLCAFILIFNDIYIHISPIDWINYSITVLWVVGIMNSINMLDNMDAITSLTSLSIIGGTIIFSIFYNTQISNFGLMVLLSVAGALLSFLFYNWSPSKMYMGDSGSQFLGAILAWVGISFFWNSVPIEEVQYSFNTKQALIVALAYIIPLSDTTTVTINRLFRKQSPFMGGKDHTTHHLFYLGLSVRWVGILYFILNSIGIFLSLYLINTGKDFNYSHLWLYFIFPVITFSFLYLNTKFTKIK
ncbi:MAG TPA: MraY family glycosyltransferase [Bacteroidales bacterium]|nr:MraY family glycosyltransferase [Bacteroidales bacterium]